MRAAVADRATAPLALPSPDWLKHRLTVSGPAAELAAFQAAAAGPGVVPWRREPAALAEGWFNRMLPSWSTCGAKPARAQGGMRNSVPGP